MDKITAYILISLLYGQGFEKKMILFVKSENLHFGGNFKS